jgi:hypothetical protein
MRDIDTLLTSEMNQEEWTEFRRRWMDSYTNDLIIECGVDPQEAAEVADIRFEDYVGQEGFTGRDERIADGRCGDYE